MLFLGRIFWRWESPRFLLARDRVYEADQVLQTISRWNGRQLPRGRLAAIPASAKNPINAKNPDKPRIFGGQIISAALLFFCQTFGYYGLTVWIRNLAIARGIGNLDPAITFVVIGVSELPGLALTTALIERAGRKVVLLVNFIGSASVSLALMWVTGRTAFLLVSSATYFFIVGSWAGMYRENFQ